MRKYLLFFLSMFSFVLGAISTAPGVEALAGEGERCGALGGRAPVVCEGGLNLECIDGYCVKKSIDPANAPIDCNCVRPETTNHEVTGGNAITCPGLPEIFCYGSGDACYEGGTGLVSRDKVNFNGNDEEYKDKLLTGFACNPKQLTAICACDPSYNKNGFKCHLESDPSVTGTATCSNDKPCAASDDGSLMNEAANQSGELFAKGPKTFGKGVNIKGVKCVAAEREEKPTLPPPPSPPCFKWGDDGTCDSFNSAFGELQTEPSGFISTLFAVLLSFSGGIALLLIIKAGYQLMTSQGKPEQVQNGRDQLIAAIVGLVFLIFSFILLQVIGYDILHIPGFGG